MMTMMIIDRDDENDKDDDCDSDGSDVMGFAFPAVCSCRVWTEAKVKYIPYFFRRRTEPTQKLFASFAWISNWNALLDGVTGNGRRQRKRFIFPQRKARREKLRTHNWMHSPHQLCSHAKLNRRKNMIAISCTRYTGHRALPFWAQPKIRVAFNVDHINLGTESNQIFIRALPKNAQESNGQTAPVCQKWPLLDRSFRR